MVQKYSADSATGVLGNTDTKTPKKKQQKIPKEKKKQSNACIKFCFTKNDIPQNEEEAIQLYDNYSAIIKNIPNIVFYIFQLELGEDNKRYHLQGYLDLEFKARFTEWKHIENGAHFTPAKGSRQHNINYCSKSNTKVKGPTIWDKSKEPKYTLEQLQMVSYDNLYDFQKTILNTMRNDNSDRDIYWYYSTCTNIGKTMIAKHLMYYDDFGLVAGDNKDIMCAIVGKDGKKPLKKGYLFNFSNDKNLKKISYASMEQMKDGLVFSPKFENNGMLVPPFKCICFANGPPIARKSDRWKVFEIREGIILDDKLDYYEKWQKIHSIKNKNVFKEIIEFKFKEEEIIVNFD